MNSRFGIGIVHGTKRCSMYGCKNIAHIYVGDKNQPHVRTNYLLCDEHAEYVYNELANKLQMDVITENYADTSIINNDFVTYDVNTGVRDKYINTLYSNSGMLSKAKLINFCKDNEIELPKNAKDLTTKEFMELMFPSIIVKEETDVPTIE